jgi:hypothetical protein
MTDEEAYNAQAFGAALEFVMATYEGLMGKKSSTQSEIRRHKSFIQKSFTEMGPTMLKACEHIGLERNHHKQHPRWKFCPRMHAMLKDLLLSGSPASDVVDAYLLNQETHRANTK